MTNDIEALKEYAKLMTSLEPLNVNLKFYFDSEDFGGAGSLRHPLVYQVPFVSNGLANKQYKEKVRAVQRAMTEKRYGSVIWLHERPYRLEAFMSIESYLTDEEYWKLLSEVWIDTENAWQNLDKWQRMFQSKRPGRENMMDAGERMVLEALRFSDECVWVYRGCAEGVNERGISWTLDEKVAERFAKRHVAGRVVKGKVIKRNVFVDRIIATLWGREEKEVLIPEFAEM